VVILAVAAALYITQRKPGPDKPPPVATAPAPTAKPAPEEPAIKYPVAAAPAPEPLPTLDQSDGPLLGALSTLAGEAPVDRLVVPEGLVRKVVVTIDNLPNTEVAERLRPLRPAPGKFAVTGTEDAPTLDPANYNRYKPVVDVIRSLDDEQLVALYVRYYPLFQEAYENLGHPPEYFNDRLIEVIDHLLATPEVRDPIALTQPNVLYEFADPKLEALSAGQKVLIRMGPTNATVVREKLRVLRAKLVEQAPRK
jgi:hypothetical protein